MTHETEITRIEYRLNTIEYVECKSLIVLFVVSDNEDAPTTKEETVRSSVS